MRCTSIQRPVSGNSMRARGDFFSSASLYCGRLAMTRMPLGSKRVISGLPGVAISPASAWRWATTPEMGASTMPCERPAPEDAAEPSAAFQAAAA